MRSEQSEKELAEAREAKAALITRRNEAVEQIAEINAACARHLHTSDYFNLQRTRRNLVAELLQTESKITQLNVKIQSLSEQFIKQPEKKERGIVEALAALRSDYQIFAADKSRVGSMRQMAAEFVLKLNPIIKQSVNQ